MAFRNALFPVDVCMQYGSRPCVMYNTAIVSKGDGNESRTSIWGPHGRQYFDASQLIVTESLYNEVLAFFHNMMGRAYSFRFKNAGDYVGTDSLIDTSDEGTTFQLRKAYETTEWLYDGNTSDPEVFTYYRDIVLPDPSTVFLTLNGDELPVSQNPYFSALFNSPSFNPLEQITASVSQTTGVITLSEAITADDELIATTFNFHVKVRFDTDKMEPTFENFQAYQASLPIIEVGADD